MDPKTRPIIILKKKGGHGGHHGGAWKVAYADFVTAMMALFIVLWLLNSMKQMTDFEKLKNHIEMTVTTEGLRIELSESAKGTFFDTGSAKLNADGSELLLTLAQELGKLPNKLSIEGHTDSQPYTSPTYGNWELSTDR